MLATQRDESAFSTNMNPPKELRKEKKHSQVLLGRWPGCGCGSFHLCNVNTNCPKVGFAPFAVVFYPSGLAVVLTDRMLLQPARL